MNIGRKVALTGITLSLTLSFFLLGTPAMAVTLAVPSKYPTLKAALAIASSGDVVTLAPGTYREFGLVVPSGVTIAGTGAVPQEVFLNGEERGRILLLESLAEMVTIRNITFMLGRAQGPSSYDQSGGAILISHSKARIENCVFSGNGAASHGGAIRCSASSPEIISCQFYANDAKDGGGGALDLSYNSSPVVRDCLFLANRAEWGGAMSCRGGSSPRVENGDFSGNSAEGRHGLGGAVFADNLSYPDLLYTTISDNRANFGGAMASWIDGPINLDYCTVVGNQASVLEGGILIVESSPLITGTIVAFNEGRGIAVAGQGDPAITCTDVYGNSAGDWGSKISQLLGTDGNVAVDPRFCTLQNGSEFRFHLETGSPLAQASSRCGTLGAKPASCSGDKALTEIPAVAPGLGSVTAAPNPFNPQTMISFELGQAQNVRVSVYGLDGRLVRVLGEGMFPPGAHELMWNGQDRSGRPVSSGMYFVIVNGQQETRRLKVTLLK